MRSRLTLAFTLGTGLFLTLAAAACTENIIQREVVPSEAGPGNIDTNEGGTPMTGDDGGTKDDSSTGFVFKAAPPGTFAQAINAGGSVVKTPKVVPIVFSSDASKDTITSFTTKLASSTYWSAISSEYGVGALTAKSPIVLNESVPSTWDDSQIEQWLVNKFSTSSATFGAPDSNTLYAIYTPTGTTVTQGGGQSCDSFGGYHFETQVGSTPISYAVVPRCASFAGLSGSDVITFAASHEILEWATDPFPQSRPAYELVDDDHAVWGKVFLGELGDLCTQMGDISANPADLGFLVQRTWSNKAAAAGHHPCAPNSTVPYFTAFPAKTETLQVRDPFGRNISTQGIKVPIGTKKTIDLTLYADAAITAFQLQVIDLSELTGSAAEFSYSLDKAKGLPGDTVHLTITSESPATQGQGFLVYTQHGNDINLFPVWVTN